MSLLIPSYKSGFARNAAESENPGLWTGVKSLWAPHLGPTGLTLKDWSGYGNDGTLTNGPTWETSRLGYANGFDGGNDLINCGSKASLDSVVPLTYAAWIYPTTIDATARYIFSKFPAGATDWKILWLQDSGPGRTIRFGVDGATDLVHISAVNVISLNQWAHVAVTWTGSTVATTAKIYLNGSEVAYSAATNGVNLNLNDSAGDLYLGNRGDAARPFAGRMAVASVYNRALALPETQQLYADPHALTRLRRRVYPAAAVPGGYTVPLSHILECAG